MFRIKICGVTTPEDAALVAAAGADAIGLNFVPASPRALDVGRARAIAAVVPSGVLKVGVFAGSEATEIRRVVESVGLDAVQLHGHLEGDGSAADPPALCAQLAGLPIIRAVRLETAGRSSPPSAKNAEPHDPLAAARRWLAEAAALGVKPDLVIVDAAVPRETPAGRLGGTGASVDWAELARTRPLGLPTALAGGLTPENVVEAIRASMTAAVDTASGVESAPGRKDPGKVRAFVAAARGAFLTTAKSR